MIIIIICIENNNQLQEKINDSFNTKGEKMRLLSLIAIMFSLLFGPAFADGHGVVNVYSARHYDSDVQLYEKFTAKTGIKVNVVSGKSGAIEKRIIEEGGGTADLYITADAGRLLSLIHI